MNYFWELIQRIIWVFGFLVLVLFLTGLGKKILRIFGRSPSRSPSESDGNLEGVGTGEELLFSLGLGIIGWGSLLLILGILGILKVWVVWGVFVAVFLICLPEVRELGCLGKLGKLGCLINDIKKTERILVIFFFSLVLLNFLGALTPEKGVDAIDYHLYFPKVYLQEGTMMLPARGSRLFSLFPHLASMIYLLPVSLNLPNVAQLFHWFLGVLTALALGLVVRKISKESFWPSILLFYSTVVVGQISRNAYSDFFVTFFLALGLLGVVGLKERDGRGEKEGKEGVRWEIIIGLILGGILATKNQSLALIPIFICFWFFLGRRNLNSLIKLFSVSFCVPFLWYIRSIILSGNPFYPIFSLNGPRIPDLGNINSIAILNSIIKVQPAIILSVFGAVNFKKFKKEILFALFIYGYWVLLPSSFHDHRYFLPYLVLIIISLAPVLKEALKSKLVRFIFYGMLGILVLVRFYTNIQYFPYIFGFEEKKVYLSEAFRNRPEDFYDIGGKFSSVLNEQSKILTENVLGLYYLDFPFIEYEYSSFYGKKFDKKEFKNLWEKEGFTHLLIKDEPLLVFLDKIGADSNMFSLSIEDKEAKTYLYVLTDN